MLTNEWTFIRIRVVRRLTDLNCTNSALAAKASRSHLLCFQAADEFPRVLVVPIQPTYTPEDFPATAV